MNGEMLVQLIQAFNRTSNRVGNTWIADTKRVRRLQENGLHQKL
jgi:hypothetical protein